MKILALLAQLLFMVATAHAESDRSRFRAEAEYYVAVYAEHYRVPVALVRAIIQQESDWQPCARSSKGAIGLMQLMPGTAERLNVANPCKIDQNIAGGIHYLAWLMQLFQGDLRLATAAYYVGEDVISRSGLSYRNPDVVAYVQKIRDRYLHEAVVNARYTVAEPRRDMQ